MRLPESARGYLIGPKTNLTGGKIVKTPERIIATAEKMSETIVRMSRIEEKTFAMRSTTAGCGIGLKMFVTARKIFATNVRTYTIGVKM